MKKEFTVENLVKRISTKLLENKRLFQLYIFKGNYNWNDLVININDTLYEQVMDYDVFSKDEFKTIFCNSIDSFFVESKFTDDTMFFCIKIRGDFDE